MNPFNHFKQNLISLPLNKQSMGWFCTYSPIEIIHAAGFEPFGIRKSSGCETEDVYLGRNLCPYIHSIFGGVLENKYGFLSGVVIAHSCECFRRLYDGWQQFQHQLKPTYAFLLDVPTTASPEAKNYFSKNLRLFIESLELHFDVRITDQKLHDSIILFNRTRSLLKRLFNLRRQPNPPVSGTQTLEILDLAMTTEIDSYNNHLEAFLNNLETDQSLSNTTGRQRLMIVGSIINPSIVEFLEQDDVGGLVVCENTCNGIRFFDFEVDSGGDPLTSLASAYLDKINCPRMADEGIIAYLKSLIELYQIDGLVYYIPKYCENLYLDYPAVSNMLEEIGIPFKRLEGEISGDFNKTELKSFIEMIELKKEMADW